jgi:DNA mismatch endonuclease (patch repair protein)
VLRRTGDLVFTRTRVVVFLDGCFWHGCPDHHTAAKTNAGYWADKVVQNRRRDQETDRLLAEAGWAVLRVWEHEPPADAAARVADLVQSKVAELEHAARNTRFTIEHSTRL